jgi:outer membrane protein assembly factor BamB/Ca2+-binding EF-hand superfamily protein
MPACPCARLLACLAIVLSTSPLAAQVPSKVGDWPQWRGPNRDGISQETGLLKEWPKEGPKVLWQVNSVGAGYSSIAVKDGRIYTQGDLNGVEHAICLNAKDGSTLWAVQPGPLATELIGKVDNEFKGLDRDKDGKIDELEALQRFGFDFNRNDNAVKEPQYAKRVAALIEKLDADKSGDLSFAEAGNLFRDKFEQIDAEDKSADAAALASKRAAAYLKTLDKDGDEKISRQEAKGSALDRYFGQADQQDPETKKGDEQLTSAEIETFLKKSQSGRDGVISAKELEDYYARNKFNGDGQLSKDELKTMFGGYRNGMGDGPRGTPTVDGDVVYVEGGHGDVSCLNSKSGETIWHVNLMKQYGGGLPGWGYSESPLVVGKLLIVTPGGKLGTMLALNKKTGEKVWQSEEVNEGAHYSTPVLAEINGIQQIVQFGNQSVFGVSLADGKRLWSYKAPANGTANCCSPIVDGNLVFASSDYGTGGGLVKIVEAGSTQQVEEQYFEKKMHCHHGGIVKVGDYMYSNGGGPAICMNFKTGKIAWQARSSGKGSLLVADGMLYLLSEGHEMTLAEATPDDFREHGKFKIESHGRPSWAHPVVAGGVLFIRDQESLAAYDVKE